MTTSQKKIYDKVADIYPYLMRTIRYDRWAKYIYELVKSSVKKDSRILELGAGNGRLANHFKSYYPNILVTDLSFNMLRQDGVYGVTKVCCDMTQIPFNSNFQLIYSAFDSINYITSRKKLSDFFKEIKRILKAGGLFTFDVSLEPNSLKYVKEPFRKGRYNGISFEQISRYNPKSRIHRNIFNMQFDNNRYVESHKQKIYPFEEYFKIIEKTGLYVSECFDAFTFKDGNKSCERVQFVVRN
jgi:ubiquinone/menaquinone biosynthesis C-methylase UbiE